MKVEKLIDGRTKVTSADGQRAIVRSMSAEEAATLAACEQVEILARFPMKEAADV